MYTLRIIKETREDESEQFQQTIENHWLGESYVKERPENYIGDDKLDELIRKTAKSVIIGSNLKKFVIWKDTQNVICSYFIMTESGKTFEKL